MFRRPWAKASNSSSVLSCSCQKGHDGFLVNGLWNKLFVWIQNVVSSRLEALADFLPKGLASLTQTFEPGGTDLGDDLADFLAEASVNFLQCGPATHHQVPDCDSELAGDGGHGEVDGPFTPTQLLPPVRQGGLGPAREAGG